MNKLLSIIGLTATGKTKLALNVAEKLNIPIDIISVDSRQLYKGMEIGTGVDLPAEPPANVEFHGFGILQPNEEWSVTQFQSYTQQQIENAWQQNRLPILVGGTGFYRHHLFGEHFPEMTAPPNEEVRQRVAQLSLQELQDWAQKVAPQRFDQMNNSDSKNPRRLIRAIEIGLATPPTATKTASTPPSTHTIGLTADMSYIETKIVQRVEERLANGMIDEVQKLMAAFDDKTWQKKPAFSATGYKEVRAYLEEKISTEELRQLWVRRELQYAKRQQTWFKKYATDARWFTVTQPDWQTQALQEIQTWLY